MSLRTFKDSQGIEWRVWDVHPDWTDRRTTERRRSPAPPYDGPERRCRDCDGRRGGTPDTEPRVRVRQGFEKGWLALQSPSERRRFAPVPDHWEQLSDQQLELIARCAQGARSTATLTPRSESL